MKLTTEQRQTLDNMIEANEFLLAKHPDFWGSQKRLDVLTVVRDEDDSTKWAEENDPHGTLEALQDKYWAHNPGEGDR